MLLVALFVCQMLQNKVCYLSAYISSEKVVGFIYLFIFFTTVKHLQNSVLL